MAGSSPSRVPARNINILRARAHRDRSRRPTPATSVSAFSALFIFFFNLLLYSFSRVLDWRFASLSRVGARAEA